MRAHHPKRAAGVETRDFRIRFPPLASSLRRTMAALRLAAAPACVKLSTPHRVHRRGGCGAGRRAVVVQAAHTVTVEHRGKTHTLTLDDDTTILEAALDAGVDLPHDCKARDGHSRGLVVGARSRVSASRAQRCGRRPAAAAASLCGDAVWRCHGSDAHLCATARVQLCCSGSECHSPTPLSLPPHSDGRLHDLPRQACEVRRLLVSRRRVAPATHGTDTVNHASRLPPLRSGEVDQSGGSMLSDDVREAGFVLLCCGRPVGDCTLKTVPEVRPQPCVPVVAIRRARGPALTLSCRAWPCRRSCCACSSADESSFGDSSTLSVSMRTTVTRGVYCFMTSLARSATGRCPHRSMPRQRRQLHIPVQKRPIGAGSVAASLSVVSSTVAACDCIRPRRAMEGVFGCVQGPTGSLRLRLTRC